MEAVLVRVSYAQSCIGRILSPRIKGSINCTKYTARIKAIAAFVLVGNVQHKLVVARSGRFADTRLGRQTQSARDVMEDGLAHRKTRVVR